MAVLDKLSPDKVFNYFEEICSIPHGSGNISQIKEYLISFAKSRDLKFYSDDIGNVVIYKNAASGYEEEPIMIIQGHMDMVAVSVPGADIDMKTEGLRLGITRDDSTGKEYIFAHDTS